MIVAGFTAGLLVLVRVAVEWRHHCTPTSLVAARAVPRESLVLACSAAVNTEPELIAGVHIELAVSSTPLRKTIAAATVVCKVCSRTAHELR